MEKPTVSVRENHTETSNVPVRKTHTTGPVEKTVPQSISGVRSRSGLQQQIATGEGPSRRPKAEGGRRPHCESVASSGGKR
jgi:hypothetical protein